MTLITFPSSFSISYHGSQKRASQRVSREEFREFMKAGMTYKEVNEKIPISRNTYDKMLDKYGFQRDHIRIRAMRENSMENMFNAGKSLEEIAKAHNITVANCKQILNNMGISYASLVVPAKKTGVVSKKEFIDSLKKSTVQGWINTYKTVENIAANVPLSKTTIYKYINFFGLHI